MSERKVSAAAVFRAVAMAGALIACAPVNAAPSASICATAGQAVREEGFVSLGGIEQWVTVKGAACANPVVLFLHGGPGNGKLAPQGAK